jgi:hypothetical protein
LRELNTTSGNTVSGTSPISSGRWKLETTRWWTRDVG